MTLIVANNLINVITKMIPMEAFKTLAREIEKENVDKRELVTILELVLKELGDDANTVSGIADFVDGTPKGIRHSNRCRKIKHNRILICINGLRNNDLPF